KEGKEKKKKENTKVSQTTKKKKNLILILGVLLVFVMLFPEEKEEKKEKQVVILTPEIKFPQQYETIDETKAVEAYRKGMELYQTFKYDDLLKASKFFLESVERKFENNPALAKLISVDSKLLPFSKNKIDDANRIFKLVQVVTTKSLT